MIFKVNIDKLFGELEEKIIEERKNIEEQKELEETQEVHEPTSKETEESHGGNEASKEIKDSPNAAKDGENSQREKSRRREKE